MKKIIYLFAFLILLGAYACKTNEANYLDDYEKAIDMNNETCYS